MTPPAPTPASVTGTASASPGSNRRHLAVVLGVAILAPVADAIVAWLSGSLALVADAAHRHARPSRDAHA